MRHHPLFTPTQRLCVLMAERVPAGVTHRSLTTLTGCSMAAVHMAMPGLVRCGLLVRTTLKGVSVYTVAQPTDWTALMGTQAEGLSSLSGAACDGH